MQRLLQLDPILPLKTPKGNGWAHVLIDYGPEADIFWVVFLDENGECWTFPNKEISMQTNLTLGRKAQKRQTATPYPPNQ